MGVFARIISTVLHPLLMPTYVFGFIFLFLPELAMPIRPGMFGTLFVLVVITTLILPCVCVFVLYKAKVVSTATIEHRTDRFIPQILTSIIYIGTWWLFYSKLSPVPSMYMVMGSMAACVLCVTVVNFFWKISAHSTSAGGVTAFLVFAFYSFQKTEYVLYIILALLFSGLLMSSRLKLQVHTLAQVSAGFLLGFTLGSIGLSHVF
jgi:membrane-associated phospholipid phosphatase